VSCCSALHNVNYCSALHNVSYCSALHNVNYYSALHNAQTDLEYTQPFTKWVSGPIFPRIKRSALETATHLSRDEAKNAWCYTSNSLKNP
jgi:hypothetical protein